MPDPKRMYHLLLVRRKTTPTQKCVESHVQEKPKFLATLTKFLKLYDLDVEDDPKNPKILRHIELIDDEAAEYGIKIIKCDDRLMAKKYGFRNPPGITYFRKGKPINYDGK